MRTPDDLVDRPAEEGSRILALALLADADAAARRLAGGDDADALHDFRVALRRLRSVLRALRPWLDESLKRRTERRVRKCARATNAARDAEVQLAWIEARREQLASRRVAPGVEHLTTAITSRRALDVARVVHRFERVSAKLRRRLGSYVRRVDAGAGSASISFGGVLATLLGQQLELLRERLDAVKGAMDVRGIHRARIEAKRLRYLLEPLRDLPGLGAREVVKGLKRLQDVLGELHDLHVLGEELEEALARAAAEHARRVHAAIYGAGDGDADAAAPVAGLRPGILAVARLAGQRRDALYAELDHGWRHGGIDALAAAVGTVEHALELRAGGRLERERKYLLSSVPPRALEEEPVEIDQGWLPGASLRERIRRKSGADGDRFWRGLKQGAGGSRLEAEEETTREVFDALWPLTDGRRISKRRRDVPDGDVVWEVDEFPALRLVVAEVELAAGGRVEIPEWLAPFVVREVTDDPAYLNENLAVHGPPATSQARAPEDGAAPAQPGGSAATAEAAARQA